METNPIPDTRDPIIYPVILVVPDKVYALIGDECREEQDHGEQDEESLAPELVSELLRRDGECSGHLYASS